eukprot:3612653-Rhodomonas_salina.5
MLCWLAGACPVQCMYLQRASAHNMGKDKGGIWGTQEKKKGGGGKKGPPSALDDDDGPKLGKKEAAAKAKMEQQMAALKEKGVQSHCGSAFGRCPACSAHRTDHSTAHACAAVPSAAALRGLHMREETSSEACCACDYWHCAAMQAVLHASCAVRMNLLGRQQLFSCDHPPPPTTSQPPSV